MSTKNDNIITGTAGEGRAYAGKVVVEDIGIPDEAYERT